MYMSRGAYSMNENFEISSDDGPAFSVVRDSKPKTPPLPDLSLPLVGRLGGRFCCVVWEEISLFEDARRGGGSAR